jgi:hypothetical protein
MTIEAVANHNQLNSVEIHISTVMTLAQWRVVADGLRKSVKENYHAQTAMFLSGIEDVIENYESKLTKKFEAKV